ncbi:MAG: YIP1 family protein [Candidatus Hodarchaeota archaeon]
MSKDTSSISPKFCGSCGKELLKGATFCAYCGAPVPTVHTSQATSAKPSSEPIISSTTVSKGYPPYPYQYTPTQKITEPPFPFFQHFQGVLLSPQNEMPQIVKRPNLKQPLLVVFIVGIFAAIAAFILSSKATIQISEAFSDPFGIIESGGFSAEEYVSTLIQLTPIFVPLGFFINWIIGGVVLWILQALISSHVPSHERNLKTELTAVGWSFLPRIFYEIIRTVIFAFFVEPFTIIADDIYDISVISAPISILGDILFFVDIIFLIWGVVLVYFAVKSIDPQGSHAIIIGIIYAVIIFFIG